MTIDLPGATIKDPSITIPTGTVIDSFRATTPEGWIPLDGKTIGNASSGANGRANADAKALFVELWNALSNTTNPVTPGGRGTTAEDDFDANKEIKLPDARGRVLAAEDASTEVLSGASIGDSLGIKSVALQASEMPSHTHGIQLSGTFNQGMDGPSGSAVDVNTTGLATEVGGSVPHENVQPTLVCRKFIKL
jgi:hypothetical protein